MVEDKKRIGLIDGVRGFSLLGILLANLLIFQYGIYGIEDIRSLNLSSSDQAFYTITKIFIEGSFMPIFAFIFGYSLILMKQSLTKKKLRAKWHLFRRALILIGFGILHGIFLWDGDILAIYGAMTILLLFFVNRKPKTLIIWGGIIFSLLFLLSFVGTGTEEELALLDPKMEEAYLTEATEIYSNGTYSEIKHFRNEVEPPFAFDDAEMAVVFIMTPFVYLPMFLFGMFTAHKKALIPSRKSKKLYLWTAIFLVPIGVGLKSSMYLDSTFDFSLIGGIVLALGYIGLFAYLHTLFANSKLTTVFENVGKLSLSNYILQTVICTYIFYGYGFGFFAKMGVMNAFFLGLVIFMIQVIGSTVYLRCYKQGPLEKVLRVLVYLRLPKFLKRKHTVEPINDMEAEER